MITCFRTAFLWITFAIFWAFPAQADDWPIMGVARLDILPGYAADGSHMAAAHIVMKPGWKTYWRSPGGNGIPPRFSWDGSRNLRGVAFHWPNPEVYWENGMRTIGYRSDLVLPLELFPQRPGQAIRLRGSVAFGICEEVCLPVTAAFDATLGGASHISARAVRAALSDGPRVLKEGLTCTITPAGDGGLRIEAKARVPGLTQAQFAVVEAKRTDVWIEQFPSAIEGGALTARATVYPLSSGPLVIDRAGMRVTILGGDRALELRGCR